MRLFPIALIAGATLLAAAACSSGGDKSDSSKGTTPMTEFRQELEKAYSGSTYARPPKTAPRPQPGKSVWVISCGQQVPDCAIAAEATLEAAKVMGWKTHLYDAGTTVDYGGGVRQAVAAGANGIITYAADCDEFKQPLMEARRAGVLVVGAEAFDCNQKRPSFAPVPGEKPLYDWIVSYNVGSFPEFVTAFGRTGALLAINKTNGRAKVVYLTVPGSGTVEATRLGFVNELRKCGGCSVVETVKFSVDELGPPIQAKLQQALLKHPDTNVVAAPADYFWTLGATQAVRASGRAGSIHGVGAEGLTANMDLLRKGGPPHSGSGLALGWEGWAEVDALNRLFNKQKPVSSGIGVQAYDKEHNTPSSGPWAPPLDYRTLYKQAWGGTP